mmetsp:Transcript_15709/g.37108  ORF Transcript_15709/g.37108 Transcript_15709/m.37108 type:complete len:306 (-) Transcript_15709:3367-4284(-)
MRALSSGNCMGLVITWSAPCSLNASTSHCNAFPVSPTINSLPGSEPGSLRIASTAWKPSMTGISLSMSTKSNGAVAALTLSTASRPLEATSTTAPSFVSNLPVILHTIETSSTSSTRRPAIPLGLMAGDLASVKHPSSSSKAREDISMSDAALGGSSKGEPGPGESSSLSSGGGTLPGSGSTKKNDEPFPSTERTPTRPWCSSMIALAIERPRPLPLPTTGSAWPTCANTWNSREMSSGRSPAPVSVTLTHRLDLLSTLSFSAFASAAGTSPSHSALGGSHSARRAIVPPADVNLMAFDSRLATT